MDGVDFENIALVKSVKLISFENSAAETTFTAHADRERARHHSIQLKVDDCFRRNVMKIFMEAPLCAVRLAGWGSPAESMDRDLLRAPAKIVVDPKP